MSTERGRTGIHTLFIARSMGTPYCIEHYFPDGSYEAVLVARSIRSGRSQ